MLLMGLSIHFLAWTQSGNASPQAAVDLLGKSCIPS